MSRRKLNELVDAHDQNYHITSMNQELSVTDPTVFVNHDSRSCLNGSLACSRHSSIFPQGDLLTPNDDTASEWSFVNGVSLSLSSSEWSFMDGIPLPASPSTSDYRSIHIIPLNDLRCNLLPPTRPEFCTEVVLQAYMASAAYAPKLFHRLLAFTVENGDMTKGMKYFSTLSGLAQHLESGACQGGRATLIRGIRYLEERLESLGFSELVLLEECIGKGGRWRRQNYA